jgi:iron(III) transport system substrate-binding protein
MLLEEKAPLHFTPQSSFRLAETLKRRFEAQHPEILVRLKRSGAERIFERIDPEGEERLRDVDVICTSDAGHFVYWKRRYYRTI